MTSKMNISRRSGSAVVYPLVARTLAKLGRDISLGRRQRRIAMEDFAQRVGVSRATLHRLEKGDPGISLNTLAMAMFVLGRLNAVNELADPAKDDVGVMIARREAPRRVRRTVANRSQAEANVGETSLEPKPDGNGFVGW